MPNPPEENYLAQFVQRIEPHSKLLRFWQPTGGVSAQVTAFELERPDGQTERLIVRRHGGRDLEQNPQIAADEFKLLQIVQSAGVAAPAPVYVDESDEIYSAPAIVLEYIEGETVFDPVNVADFVLQLATQLAKIHGVDGSIPALSFLPKQGRGYGERPHHLDESLGEGAIRETLESIRPVGEFNEPGLLHGDFWPGNVLWKDGRLVGVIDWEDAALGDPLADLANGRLEILWAFGIDAMFRFTHDYQSMAPFDFANLAYWDLCAALRPASKIAEWGLDDMTEQAMREGHRLFVAQAMEKLSHRPY